MGVQQLVSALGGIEIGVVDERFPPHRKRQDDRPVAPLSRGDRSRHWFESPSCVPRAVDKHIGSHDYLASATTDLLHYFVDRQHLGEQEAESARLNALPLQLSNPLPSKIRVVVIGRYAAASPVQAPL